MQNAGLNFASPPYSQLAATHFETASKIDCSVFRLPKSAIILIAGQSNAANYVESAGENKYPDKIFNYFNDRCASATDPLMGADGDLGSSWIRLANKLIESKQFDRVLLVPVALGGTSMIRWEKGGDLERILQNQFQRLKIKKIPVTHFFWVQGEAERSEGSRYRRDLGVSYFDALLSLKRMSANYFENSKMYIVPTSRCKASEKPAPEIRWAQTAVVNLYSSPTLVQGPDLDAIIDSRYRNSGCHLTSAGAEKFSDEWLAILSGKT